MATIAHETVILNGTMHSSPLCPTLILGDEMALVREGLAAICQTRAHCKVVEQCSDGVAALQAIKQLRPDLALLDLNLPGLFTLEIIRQVKQAGLPTSIGVISNRGDRKTVLEALRSGASAFLLKSGPCCQLHDAIYKMMDGGVYISPMLNTDQLFTADDGAAGPVDPFEKLSSREFQVFTMLVDGVRAKEIAARLGLSPKTVDTYRSSLMQKLEIFDLAGLVRFAIHRSFLTAQ